MENEKKEVKVTPPGPLSRKITSEENNFIFPPLKPYSISLESASNLIMKDIDDNTYIDFTSGGLESSIGHSNKVIAKKIYEQSQRIICNIRRQSTNTNFKELAVQLISSLKIKQHSFKIFFGLVLEDCLETALKILKEKTGKNSLLSTTHGCIKERVLKSDLWANSRKGGNLNFTNILNFPAPYCFRCVFKLDKTNCSIECLEYIENFLFEQVISRQEIAAIIIEPIMVKGGCIIPPEKFFNKLNMFTQKYNLPLIANEAEVGLGRTGSWLASDRFNLKYDLLILNNSLANGLPLSVLIGKTEIFDSVDHWFYARRSNILSCSVAIEVIKYIKKYNLLENANRQGLYLKKRLNELAGKFDQIGDIRCIGLIAGIELIKNDKRGDYDPIAASKIVRACLKSGLIAFVCGKSTLLLTPALTVDSKTIDESIMILEKVLSEKIR